jgi:hypothetical protein
MEGCWKSKFKLRLWRQILHLLLGRWSFVLQKIMAIPIGFIWNIILFDKFLNFLSGGKFWGYVGTKAEPLFNLLSKNESKLIKSPVCLCLFVCPPLIL